MRLSGLAVVMLLAAAAQAAPPPLRFQKTPLGNVARVIGARMGGISITIAANATAPVTGDFSRMSPRDALAAAARQAGLVVVPLGATPAAGFSLVKPAPAAASRSDPAAAHQAELAEAERRREALLRRQAALLQEAP